MKTKGEELLGQGSFLQLCLKMCLPSVIVMLVTVVYNMADTYFIGQTGDPDKIAALSLCGPIFSILSAIGTLFGNGGCTVISLALGKKEYDRIKKCSSFCFACAAVIGIIFFVGILVFLDPICKLLGADEDTIIYMQCYLKIFAFGAPALLINNISSNIIRADGATLEAMICNLIGSISNIVLDAIFILILKMDVAGAALATVLANIFGCLYLVYYIVKRKPVFSVNPKYIQLKKDIILEIISLGMPLACGTLMMSVSNMISNRIMISYGAVAVAAQGVAGKIGMLTSMLIMGICMGLQPAISYAFASGNKRRLREIIIKLCALTMFIGTALSTLAFVFRNQLILFFIDNEEVIREGQIFVIASIIIGPFYGVYQLCQTYLQATGKASYATVVALLDKGIFYLPILLIMNVAWGKYGVVFAGTVTLFFSIIASIFLSLKWKKMEGENYYGK